MKKFAIIFIVILVLGVGAVLLFNSSGSQMYPNNSAQQNPAQSSANTVAGATPGQGIKLSDEPYADKTYLISSDTLSAQSQKAIAGFQIQKQSASDGGMNIALKAINPEYHDQQYHLRPGDKLYFIEANLGDDSGNKEYSLSDDSAVVVDSNGYIVSN